MKTGEYYLEGAMEVGSGFRFKPDYTFDFFYSYGTIDRVSQGHWRQTGDNLILNNGPKPDKDFVFASSQQKNGKQLVIQINDPNDMVLRNVYCQIHTQAGLVLEGSSDAHGRIEFDATRIERIALIHRFWPDRYSLFDVTNPRANYFEFMIGPWIADVEFVNLTLHVEENILKGPHPLLEGREWNYVIVE